MLKSRFIAGARCSACGLQDVVKRTYGVSEQGAEVDYITCVSCGHEQGRPAPDQTQAQTQARQAEPAEEAVVQIRAFDPKG